MNFKKLLVYTLGLSAMLTGCDGGRKTAEDGFRYTVDEFADIKIMRYRIPGWDSLTFRQKSLGYSGIFSPGLPGISHLIVWTIITPKNAMPI